MLAEEKLTLELKEKEFDLLEFYDHVEFRYAYEMNYRSIWDRGEQTDLVVVLRLQDSELGNLPFDLLQSGRKLHFNLGTIFPNFSYPVIEQLDYQHLDDLYAAQEKYHPDRMGDNATKDFILRHVFGIAAELIQTPVDLLRCLLGCHYASLILPTDLWDRLISAAYPFWFNVARQVGRLLNLQDQITKQQIVRRLKEQYGDRQTVSRITRYVIRSFVAWGVLKDTDKKGCYGRGDILRIHDQRTASLLIEGALHTLPEGKSSANDLHANPGFFIFEFPIVTGELIAQDNQRIDVMRFGVDEEIVTLDVPQY